MYIIYEDKDFKLTCSDTNFDKFVIFCPSASGLPRVTLNGIIQDQGKKDALLDNIYTSLGINEINFIPKTANWYQGFGEINCINILKKIINGHENNSIIYGSSMGGFAAIHFGLELNITSVAFSPQVVLKDEFDIAENWKKVSDYVKFNYGKFKSNILDKKNLNKIYLFFDGTHILDRKHAVYIIKNYKNCISFNIPWGGHACSGKINKIYKIKNIIYEIIENKFDKNKFKQYFFQHYNIEENREYSAWSKFKYLYNIINEHQFYIKLGQLRSKNYFDLCIGVCHTIEKYFPSFLDKCIECLINNNKIIKHLYNIDKINDISSFIDNSYERKKACALFYKNRNKYSKAEMIYRELYEVDKYNINISGNLAIVIMKQGRLEESLNILFRNILLIGKNDENMSFLSNIYFLNKDYKNARKWIFLSIKYCLYFNKKIKINYIILYSRTLKEEGYIKEAVQYLKNNFNIGKDSGDFLAHLGAYSIMINQKTNGLYLLHQAKQKKEYPRWVDIWINKCSL